jgi:hypothetical protein
MNASRTVAFASLAPVAAAQDAPAAARPPMAGRPRGTARRRRPDPQWPLDREGRSDALLLGGAEKQGYQEIEDAWPRPRHLARRPRHHLGLRPTRYARSADSSPRTSAVASPHHIDAWHGWSPDVEADGRSATVRAPGPGHRHHLDRHRHSQDRAHLTPPDHSAREGPDQHTDIKMTESTDNELRPLTWLSAGSARGSARGRGLGLGPGLGSGAEAGAGAGAWRWGLALGLGAGAWRWGRGLALGLGLGLGCRLDNG